MNWDQVAGEWKQLSSVVKSKWAKLTDNDVQSLSAKKDNLVGKIQERYGILKEEAERQVDEWIAELSPKGKGTTDPKAKTEPKGTTERQSRPSNHG